MIKNSLLTLRGGSGRGKSILNLQSYLQNDSTGNSQSGTRIQRLGQQAWEANDNEESEMVSIHHCDDVEYYYVKPITRNAGYNFLAECIKTLDFNNVRIAVICEHPTEAKEMMHELGKRSVACLLLNAPNESLNVFIRLWYENLLNSVLVTCDNVLQLLLAECANLKVDFLIHSTQPMPHVFQKRIQALIQTDKLDTQVLIIKPPEKSPTTAVKPKTIELDKTPEKVKTQEIKFEMQQKVSPKESKVISSKPTQVCTDDTNNSTTEIVPSPSFEDLQISEKSQQVESEYIYRNFGILAWSRFIQVSCFSIRDTKIDACIKDAMKKLDVGHARAKSVQRYAWPHLATGRSLCVVGNDSTGKTWCYLPWLCDRLIKDLTRQQQHPKPGDCGPRAIVVCAGAKQGEHIADLCLKLLEKTREGMEMGNLVVKLFDRQKIHDVANELKRPCGILVTNVDFMLQLWPLQTKAAPIFNRTSIRSVAIDNLDVMWRCVRLDSEKMFRWMMDYLQFDENHTQMIIASRLWSEMLMHKLMPKLPDILLVFEDALEATVYGGFKLDMLFPQTEHCDEEILKLVKGKMAKKKRHVVICQTYDDTLDVSNMLCRANIKNSIVDLPNKENNHPFQPCSESERILIVTDNAVPKLRGESIDCLIHYNFASGWSRFKARFGLFFGNFKPQQPKMDNAKSVIMLRPQDSELIWFICDFMLKHDRSVPDSWLQSLTNYRIKLEQIKPRPDQRLCRQLLSYGNCCRRTCQFRHILWDYEVGPPLNHPTKGEIRFHVLLTISPSQLAIKLIDYEISTYVLNVPMTKLGESIQMHYEVAEHRKRHHHPEVADICVVRINKQYQRVGVTRVEADRIEVKQLDAGVEFNLINESDLLVCEERFLNEPFQANDVRITGLTPFNMERIWQEDYKFLVRKKFFNRQQGKPYRVFTAKVDFAIHEMIFVENVYDEDGNDLKSFVLNNIHVHMDESVKNRLKCVASMAKPFLRNDTD